MRGGLSATRALVERRTTTASRGPSRTSSAILEEAKLPDRVRDRARRRRSPRSPRSRAGSTAARRPRCTSTRSAATTRSSTSSAPPRRSSCSGSTRCARARSRPAAAWCGAATACSRTPLPRSSRCSQGRRVYGREIDVELTTPTGAAILAAHGLGLRPDPADDRSSATGYGAGRARSTACPNCTQVVIGSTRQRPERRVPSGQPLVLLEANLDDATGEQVADALAALFEAGAADAWITPVLMKKGRPGQVALRALRRWRSASSCARVLLDEAGILRRARSSVVDRFALERRVEAVEVDGQPVRVKVSPGRAKVEHDDARARPLGVSASRSARSTSRSPRQAWPWRDRRPNAARTERRHSALIASCHPWPWLARVPATLAET